MATSPLTTCIDIFNTKPVRNGWTAWQEFNGSYRTLTTQCLGPPHCEECSRPPARDQFVTKLDTPAGIQVPIVCCFDEHYFPVMAQFIPSESTPATETIKVYDNGDETLSDTHEVPGALFVPWDDGWVRCSAYQGQQFDGSMPKPLQRLEWSEDEGLVGVFENDKRRKVLCVDLCETEDVEFATDGSVYILIKPARLHNLVFL